MTSLQKPKPERITSNDSNDTEDGLDVAIEDNKEEKEEEEEEIPNYGGIKKLGKDYGSKHKCYTYPGYIAAALNGTIFPLFGVIFQESLVVLTSSIDEDGNTHFEREALKVLIYFVAMGVGSFVFTYLQYLFWGTYGTLVGIDVRKEFFEALVMQEISYHDEKKSAALNTELTTETAAIENGLGVKIGFAIQNLSGFIFGIGLSFYYSWMLACTLLGCMPIIIVVGIIAGMFYSMEGKSSDAFADCGTFSQEVLTNVKTVLALPLLAVSKNDQYQKILVNAYPVSAKRDTIIGFGIGIHICGMFFVYAIGLYAGARYVEKGWLTVADMFGSYFTFLMGGMALGQIGSVAPDIQKASAAANKFYHIKQRKPEIRCSELKDDAIKSKDSLKGKIEFKNVTFAYASNPEENVLDNVSFSVDAGQTLALVGPSGSGKSTAVSLLERFYDPLSGDILIDGEKIHNYDIEYLRSQIGLVSQMPLLFDASVKDNIRGGNVDATEDDIKIAAGLANADEFIQDLPDKYDTGVGEMGDRLSGGQRQRVAIARAMLNRPSILLLDEATSALDSKSELEVQQAIDKISATHNQTVVAIAHRLSTIKDADVIVVLLEGKVREIGRHEELIQRNGVYSTLVNAQNLVALRTKLHRQRSDTDNKDGDEIAGTSITAPASKVA